MAQWYPTKRNSKVWPGLVTKEKTMKYPTSAICTVCVYVQGIEMQTQWVSIWEQRYVVTY